MDTGSHDVAVSMQLSLIPHYCCTWDNFSIIGLSAALKFLYWSVWSVCYPLRMEGRPGFKSLSWRLRCHSTWTQRLYEVPRSSTTDWRRYPDDRDESSLPSCWASYPGNVITWDATRQRRWINRITRVHLESIQPSSNYRHRHHHHHDHHPA